MKEDTIHFYGSLSSLPHSNWIFFIISHLDTLCCLLVFPSCSMHYLLKTILLDSRVCCWIFRYFFNDTSVVHNFWFKYHLMSAFLSTKVCSYIWEIPTYSMIDYPSLIKWWQLGCSIRIVNQFGLCSFYRLQAHQCLSSIVWDWRPNHDLWCPINGIYDSLFI